MKHYKDNNLLIALNILSEYILLVSAFFISGFIRLHIPQLLARKFNGKEVLTYSRYGFIVPFILIAVYFLVGDFATIHIRNITMEAIWIFAVQLAGTLMLAGLLFLEQDRQFSRFYLLLYELSGSILLLIKRIICKNVADRFFAPRLENYNILLVGSGHTMESFFRNVKAAAAYYNPVGYLSDTPEEQQAKHTASEPGKYLGTIDRLQDILSRQTIHIVVVSSRESNSGRLQTILSQCSVYGIKAYILPEYAEYITGSIRYSSQDQFLLSFGTRFKLIPVNAMNKNDILGVNIAVTNMEKTLQDIEHNLEAWRGEYICVSNVHTTVMAHDNEAYRSVQNGAVMALPDGGPLSAYSRANGSGEAERVTGPDLMKEVLKRSGENGWRHYFYGSTEETLDKLRTVLAERYPGAEIAGMISPPFRELTPEEDEEYVRRINESHPDFLWVGLGAPKQEVWMSAHKDRVNCLMIGVGAAFDYEAGNIKRAPKWMQKMSLEWLYRLLQDPKRLFKRYFKTNLRYLWMTRR